MPAVLEPIDDLADEIVGLRAVGAFTVDDFTTVIEPKMEQLAADHHELRLLLHLGDEFDGFGEGAWGELTDELRRTRFHKGALVTDDGHLRAALNLLKWALHGHVRTFQNHEYDLACSWVAR